MGGAGLSNKSSPNPNPPIYSVYRPWNNRIVVQWSTTRYHWILFHWCIFRSFYCTTKSNHQSRCSTRDWNYQRTSRSFTWHCVTSSGFVQFQITLSEFTQSLMFWWVSNTLWKWYIEFSSRGIGDVLKWNKSTLPAIRHSILNVILITYWRCPRRWECMACRESSISMKCTSLVKQSRWRRDVGPRGKAIIVSSTAHFPLLPKCIWKWMGNGNQSQIASRLRL